MHLIDEILYDVFETQIVYVEQILRNEAQFDVSIYCNIQF